VKGVGVNVHPFFVVHKKEPRGFGMWVFMSSMTSPDPLIFRKGGSYDKARRAACLWAKQNGLKEVYLCP